MNSQSFLNKLFGQDKKLVLCFVGSMGNGKTTIARHFQKLIPNVKTFAVATRLKEFSSRLLDVPLEIFYDFKETPSRTIADKMPGIETPRQVMQLLGSGMRSLYPNYWIDQLITDMTQTDFDVAIVEDCRYQLEIDTIRTKLSDCRVLTIYITRYIDAPADTTAHESESLAKTFFEESNFVFLNDNNVVLINDLDALAKKFVGSSISIAQFRELAAAPLSHRKQ